MSTHVPKSKVKRLPDDVRMGIVASQFNDHIVSILISGCRARLKELGVTPPRVDLIRVPGAFELPLGAKWMAQTKQFDAIICLGCVIRGDTPHFEYVAGQAAAGIQRVSLDENLPVIFGVLTVNTEQQARDRAGGAHSHAGKDAANTAAQMIAVARKLRRAPREPQ